MNPASTRRLARRAAVVSLFGLLLLTAIPAHWLRAAAHQLVVRQLMSQATGTQTAAWWPDFVSVIAPNRKPERAATASLNTLSATLFASFTVNDLGDTADASAGNGVCATAGGVCTLRAAIQEANALAGTDTITFSVNGTINLTSALPDLSSNLTIDNTAGPAALTVRRSSGGNYRIFNIASGVTVTLDGLTITNGRADEGGGIRNAGTLTIQDCTISGNNTVGARPLTGGGAGVFNDSTGVLNILRSAILDNAATGQAGGGGAGGGGGGGGLGGGIYNDGGSVMVANATISGNQAIGGAGANADSDCCVFGGGFGGGNGGDGGVWNAAGAQAGGFGGGGGGGANGQGGAGGGRFGGGGGGGINISGNPGGGTGGFLGGNGGSANSSQSRNGAGGGGGGAGGAVFQNGGSLSLTNVTLVNNSAAGGAGGTSTNNTQDGTDGGSIAGGIYNETGTLTIKNSIIAANTADSNNDCGSNSTAIVTNGFNLSGTGGGCPNGGTSDQTIAASSIFTTVLGSLNYYGGLTPSYVPLTGSPAIDKGGAGAAEDQRGETRPFDTAGVGSAGSGNASDIGAVESVSFSNPAVTNTNYGGLGSLARAVVVATSGSTITVSATGTITTYSGDLLIDRNLTINGPGAGSLTVSGNDSSRVFFVNTGTFSLSNLTVAHGRAAGGNGAGGGGGAAGLGAGMFVNTGTVTLTNVPFANNQAVGGNGGSAGCCSAGGGGGIGGNGLASGSLLAGDGGDGGSFNTPGGKGGASGVNGADGGDGAGGGGAGSQASGGDGGFGGGGGGGGFNQSGGPILSGGTGGFGGGGGAGNSANGGNPFAGVGGASGLFGGAGGNGGGGFNGGGGGGGGGLGGALFVRAGSVTLAGSNSFTNNTATRGNGGNANSPAQPGGNGQGKGGAIFINSGATGGGTITFSGNTATDALATATDNSNFYGNFTQTVTVAITAGGPLTRQQGSAASNSTIATVSDSSAGTLTVTATTVPAGITVASIVNASGTVTANVAASCSATTGSNTVVLTVTNGSTGQTRTANLTVNVTANALPTLSYNNASVIVGNTLTINPATGPSDNGSVASIVLQSDGTYTGTISVNNSTGVVSISNAAPVGSHTITIRATDNCGTVKDTTFTLTVAAMPDGGVIGWGDNGSGELNIPANALSDVTAIAAGDRHNLALKNGAVMAWGINTFGQLTIPVAAQSGVMAIAAGTNHSLALKNGGVIVWGYNGEGQLTVPVAAQSGVTDIAAGGYHSLALKNGGVIAWGRNDDGEVNVPVAAQSGVIAIAGGYAHSMALKSTGEVVVWGNNDHLQLSVPVAAQSGVTAIAGGKYHCLALKNGGVIGWGYNGQGQRTIPTEAQSDVIAIAAGSLHSLALKSTGQVIGWGSSAFGQTTIPLVAQSGVLAISGGENHSLALKPLSPPTITAGAALTRQQGTAGSVATIATVSDGETSPGSLTVTATTVPAGITVTSITNTSGTITANVAALCTATVGANTVVLTVTDGGGETDTANLTVNLTANAAPTLTYGGASVNAGGSTTNSPTAATDNGSITGYAVQSRVTYTGTISVNASGQVSVSNAAPVGMHTITIRATDNCGTTTDASFTLNVVNNAPTITAAAALTRQRGTAGSASTIATASDGETAAGSLVVTATTVPAGITVTSISNTAGTITANVAADCTATLGANTVVLTVTDGNGGTDTANLTVNVTANTAPALTYATASVNAGGSTSNSPTAASDNGSITGYALQSQGTYTGTISVNASGVVSISNAAPVGNHTITIRATDNCGATTNAMFTLAVNAAATTTTITNAASLSGTPTVVGQAYAVNVGVTAASGTPTSTVTVSDGSQSCTITLPATSCNLTSTSPGAPKTITATYNGDANFGTSSGTASHTVNKASTTTAITNAAALGTPTVVGQAYSVAASVSITSPGAGMPGGTITVSDGSQSCTITLPATSCNLTSTTAGMKTITATYNGDANFNGSTSSGVSHTVNKASTTTTITNAATLASTPTVVGQAVAINWSVAVNAPSAVGAALTGNVTMSDGTQSCTAAVGAGTCSITFTTTGTKTLTATYAGDANYNGSASANATHTVNAAATTTTITNAASLSGTSTVVGQAYAVNVSVTATPPAMGTPTGTVTVNDGSQTCTLTLPATSCNLTSTSPGAPKTVTATYSGDADFSTSSGTASHTVNKASTTISNITDSPDPSVTGQSYTAGFTLNITSPGAGTPTGTVTITDGTGGACTATLPATSCSLTSATVGAKTLTITYNGDGNFNTSNATAGHQVNKADTVTTITSDNPDPSVFGGNVVINFTVAAAPPGAGTPTGNVVITVSGGAETCTGTIAAGACTLALTTLGNRTLTAVYAGDANYNGSSDTEAHTVNKADTTTTIVSDNPDSSAVGQNVTVVFTVTATAPGTGTPSGNVTVSDGVNSCTGTVAAGSCVVALTTPGARTLTATYAGDTNFNGSSDTESHTVVAPPSIAKVFAPASTPIGGTTILTLTITNPASNQAALTGLGFTDTFPAGLVVATPLVMNNTCGGTLTNDSNNPLSAGAPGIKLSGGTVNASPGNACTVSVNVTPTTAGPFNNVTSSVASTNGGTGNMASATLLTNTAPTISSNTLAPQAGSSAASFTVATAVDPDQPVNTLGITINGNPTTASSNGVTVSGVTITPSGAVTANISTTCAATSATFTLVVTDNENATGTGTLTVNMQPNQPPMLTYANQTVMAGTTPAFLPMAGPSDNGAIASLSLQGVTPNNSGLTVSVNPATGQVQVTGATLIGSYAVAIGLTDNCGATATATLTVNVVCPTISVNPSSLPGTAINTSYSQIISASPAGGNYSFAVTSGLLPAGLTLNANGSFSGAPTNSGTFNFRVTATGFGGCTAFRDYVLVVSCPVITVTPSSLPGGAVGAAYSQTVSATPAGSYAYSVSSGALPTGLTLNASSGAITGAPSTIGSFTFTITAAAGACSDSRMYMVVIGCSTITFSPASPLPGGQVGVVYNQTIGINPSGSYTLSLISGSLPSGLTLNPATGVISGLPTTTGSFNFTIRALAGNGCEASQTYTLAMNCPTVVLTPASLPDGSIGTPYSQTVAAAPAGGNYIYAVTTGSLPAGLNLNQATGVLSGTPTLSGTSSFTITATGFGGCAGSKTYSITVSGGGCPIVILPDIATSGAIGSAYNQSVAASPSGSYGYTLTGTPPPGVTFYNAAGLLFGYPSASGTYNFTVTATDSNNCTGSKSYSVTIGGVGFARAVFGDFDGDGKTDFSVWRGQQSDWLIIKSSDSKLQTAQWGAEYDPYNDVIAPGDYDGDGKFDVAVFRRATSQWLIKCSKDGSVMTEAWGLATDTPVPADYDGDGKTDIAVWRGAETNWYIQRSSDHQLQIVSWGTSNAPYRDVPVPADYDGDGKADIAVFRQSNGHWYIRQSSDGQVIDKYWGLGSDVPVSADYDGDGKADIAVWRGADTNWYIVRSSDSQTETVSWGGSWLGDVPVPGDYDGDGKTDVAVWRAGEGRWYVKCSLDGSVRATANGQAGDTPVMAKQR